MMLRGPVETLLNSRKQLLNKAYVLGSVLGAIGTMTGCIVPIDPCTDDSECVTGNESACWITTCNSEGFCTSEFPDGPCNDGSGCTDDDQCVDGECIGTYICTGSQLCVGGTCQTPR